MKTIILCGGMGTRLREETEYKPKPMVEIGGRPILWHIMKHYSFYGYNEFILALGYKGDVIRDYFLNYYKYNRDFTVDLSSGDVKIENEGSKNNWKVTLVETGDESMTGYRTKLAGEYVQEERFMLTYGDAVATVNLKNLVAFHKQKGTIGTVTGVYPPSRFGDLVVTEDMVSKFKQQKKDVESQQPINGGYFVFKKEFLDIIPNDPKADLEGVAMDKIVESENLSVFDHKGFWHSMDTFRDNQQLNKMWNDKPEWKIW
jgi:glucose-1-phosphate cytidylyltransferase